MADEPSTRRNYPVGRGKTPEHSRYKPGQSGNPKGRPKGARNLKTEFNEEMNERIVVPKLGDRKFSKRRLLIKRTLSKAGDGSVAAQRTLLELDLKLNGIPEDKVAMRLSPAEQALLDRMNALLAGEHLDPPPVGDDQEKDNG